jgi:hypothetical protein
MAELLEINLAAKKLVAAPAAAPVAGGEWNGNGFLTLPLETGKKYVTRNGHVVLAGEKSTYTKYDLVNGGPSTQNVPMIHCTPVHGGGSWALAWRDVDTGKYSGSTDIPVGDIVRDYISDLHTAWVSGEKLEIRFLPEGDWYPTYGYSTILTWKSNSKKEVDNWYRSHLLSNDQSGNLRVKPE